MLQRLPDARILLVIRAHDRPLEKKKKIVEQLKTNMQGDGFIITVSLPHIWDYIESATD